jgi:hypothetical protein
MPDGRLAFFDFGMVGRITPDLQAKMIDAFFHVVGKDPAGDRSRPDRSRFPENLGPIHA